MTDSHRGAQGVGAPSGTSANMRSGMYAVTGTSGKRPDTSAGFASRSDGSPQPGADREKSVSLHRALLVLDYVRDHAGPVPALTLTQIAEALGLSTGTALRLATPLLDARLLARDPDSGRFRLGPGALALGQAYLAGVDLRSVASEEAHGLVRDWGGTVHVCVPDAPHVVCTDVFTDVGTDVGTDVRTDKDEAQVRAASLVWSRAPMAGTAVGKAMLAWQPEQVVGAVVAARLPRVSADTCTRPEELRGELARIRTRGYAVDDRECEPRVRCVAAPIFDHDNAVAGALSVSGLTSRLTAVRVRELGPAVAAAAQRISRTMGATR